MGQALYRKYRSKKLSEIVGQKHITTTLENALKTGAISHAYLFTGPRGVGKTSIARILAHEVNSLPYDPEVTHLDIIEIDAASNRRIDEIRELREKIHTTPTSAKYKVYIIDEVHMLTREAFNALLKTLEEPPAHAIFILATTEVHKVPETIISRTQRFSFKPVEKSEVINHLDAIAKQEGIKVNRDALELIAKHGDGSFRDSISLLDQLSGQKQKILLDDVQTMLGIAPDEAISNLLTLLASGDTPTLVAGLVELRAQGYQSAQLAHQLSVALREELLNGKSYEKASQYAGLLNKLLEVPASHNPDSLLELILIEASLLPMSTPSAKTESVSVSESAPAKAVKAIPDEAPLITTEKTTEEVKINPDVWNQVLQAIKKQHTTLYGIARMAVPEFEDGELTLRFAFPFHQKRLNEEKNRRLISEIMKKQTGQTVTIICVVDKTLAEPNFPETKHEEKRADPIDSISNIFGPSEVLES